MYYRIFLILFICLMCASPALWAQDSRYRVEVIVLSHINHGEEAREVNGITDYSEATDFLTPAVIEEEPGDEADEQPLPDSLADGLPEQELPAELQEEADPNALVHVEEMSEVMQDAWRRLRLSGPFRPLQYLSWEQGDMEPFPSLRVHDLEPVMVDDPWAKLREELDSGEIEESATFIPGPTATPAQPLEENTGAATLDTLPPPKWYYALDGTVSLVRKRFLHLYIDLQQREALYQAPDSDPLLPGSLLSASPRSEREIDRQPGPEEIPATEIPQPTSFKVFAMQQNRQVRSGRIEYFDGPVLSVLAYITAIPLSEDEN